MLGGAYGGARDLLPWAVGLEQQRRRRLFVLKVQVAACAKLAGAGRWYAMSVN